MISIAPPEPEVDDADITDPPVRLGFMMDQIAGHITNYRNLRGVAERDEGIRADWREVQYRYGAGGVERARQRLPFVAEYATGVARGTLDLHRGLRNHQYEAVFTNASVAPLKRRALGRTPWMYDFDSTPIQRDQMETYTQHTDAKPVARLKWWLMRDLFHSATRLQAWSHWAKQSVVDDYGVPEDRIVVNPPGVDLARWRPRPDARERRRPAQVLFVGGDFRRKGGEVLLDWFRTQNPDEVELQIVTREQVSSARGVHVHRDMQPNSEQLRALYHQCDVFVLPSLGECFGIATVEAMATGLPVVVTNVGGTADIVEHGRNGYLVTPNSVGELSLSIDAILGDDARRSWMGLQARRIAEVRFDLETNAKRTIDELKRMALERRDR